MNLERWNRKIVIFIFAAAFFHCTKENVKKADLNAKEVNIAYNDDVKAMIEQIDSINRKSPSTFSLSFEIVGSIKQKKFKSIGSLEFSSREDAMNAVFLDYIFKSPITTINKNANLLNIYFPADNKLILDDARTMNLRNYLEMNLDFNLLYSLLIGKIPLIENYRVKQGLLMKSGNGSYLIIENDNYYQTISFNNIIPDKLLLLKKGNSEKIEIYIKDFVLAGETRYFKTLRILIKSSEIELDFIFDSIRLNIPVKVKTVNELNIPRNVKLIKM